VEAVRPILEDRSVLKIGQNLKFDWVVMKRHEVEIGPYDDTMLMSYVLDAGRGGHGMDELARRHLGHTTISFSDVAGTGRGKVTFDRIAIDKATAYAAEDVDVTLRLWRLLKPRLVAERRLSVYEVLERGLVEVLGRMELRGIRVDRDILSRLSGDFAQSLARLEYEIHEMAGETFSLGSPKQIGDILFGRMGLPGAKKTPSGQWATPATLLDELAAAGHELPKKILEWRQLSKLEIDLHRHAPGAHVGRRARPHLLRARCHHHRPAVLVGPEPPKHPDPHGSGAQDPHGLRGGGGPQADLGRLQPDRAQAPRPHGRHPAAPAGLRGWDRHSCRHRLRHVRGAARRDEPGPAPKG
jgi:DNA polymerase-1